LLEYQFTKMPRCQVILQGPAKTTTIARLKKNLPKRNERYTRNQGAHKQPLLPQGGKTKVSVKIFGDSLYTVVEGPTWHEAQGKAAGLGGNLVTIETKAENSFLGETFGTKDYFYQTYTPGWDLWDFNTFWIGLTDKESEGTWKWSSGKALEYKNWAPGYPSNPDGWHLNGSKDPNGYDYAIIAFGLSSTYPVPFGAWSGGIPNNPKDIPPYTPWAKVGYKGIAEIPLSSKIWLDTPPTEGKQAFTTKIKVYTGTGNKEDVSLTGNGQKLYWKITGITQADLADGELTGSGTTKSGEIELKHSLKVDADKGESFNVSVFSDKDYKYQIGKTFSSKIEEKLPSAFSLKADSAKEDGDITFTIERTGDVSGDASIVFATKDGSAKSGLDYVAKQQEVSFKAGENSKKVTVAIINDKLDEPDEDFIGTISTTDAEAVITTDTAKATILDDDEPPQPSVVSITASSTSEAGEAVFEIRRAGGIDQTATISFDTENGTAKAGEDYKAESTDITFAAGQSTKYVYVTLIDDKDQEPEEFFYGKISSKDSLVTLKESTAKLTIQDDDKAPEKGKPRFSLKSGANREGREIQVILTRDTEIDQEITFSVSTADGSAKAGLDYAALKGKSISFKAGEKSQTITITTKGDKAYEGDEYFSLVIDEASKVDAVFQQSEVRVDILEDDLATYDADLDGMKQGKGQSGKKETVKGTEAADILGNSKGVDTLIGNAGADQFVFIVPGFGSKEADRIKDFSREEGDQVLVSKKALKGLTKPVFAVASTAKELASLQVSDANVIYYNTKSAGSSGKLFYNQNGKKAGYGSGGLFATLAGAPELNASDLLMI